MWYVESREYAGEGYYYDYPPLEFANEEEARAFADRQKKLGASGVQVYEKK